MAEFDPYSFDPESDPEPAAEEQPVPPDDLRYRPEQDTALNTFVAKKYKRGADLTALVREASVNAFQAHMKSRPLSTLSGHTFSSGPVVDIWVTRQNFEDAFKKVRPSVSKKDQRMYEQLRESLTR